MCGFVGEISREPTVSRPLLYRMNNTLAHRGPDESGIVVADDGRWGVAHRRLSVIDIEGGKQPMRDAERGLTLVYNGEIYDHDRLRDDLKGRGRRFHTTSDTEVLLGLYAVHGLDFFSHLRGEFAFAIIDEQNREAILVRDRMGLKPIFYTKTANGLLFASEIKALFRHPDVKREIDPTGLLAAIIVAETPGRTAFKGIRQVRHSHFLKVNLDTLDTSEHRYWDAFENRRSDIPAGANEQIEMVRDEVNKATALRLRADVPVGAYLSGGLDSSLVTGVMAGSVDSVDAFGLAFDDSQQHNEFNYAEDVARQHPAVRLHRIPVTYEGMVRRLPETVYHMERPFGNLHSVAKIMQSQYAREHVVCVLTGDGGDECFCGYSTHWLQSILQQANYSLPAIRQQLAAMRREASGIGSNDYYLSNGLAKSIGSESKVLQDKLGFRPADLATSIGSQQRIEGMLNPDFRKSIEEAPVDRLVDQLAATMPAPDAAPHAVLLQYVQLNTSVPEYIATIADRAETAGSVEARPPLFDHKVAELALGLPLEIKLKGDREKHVLREAYKGILPRTVIDRRKQAFLAPPAPYQSAIGKALVEHYLSPKLIREAGIWHPAKIAAMKVARWMLPRNPTINLGMTVVLTTQILYEQLVKQERTWK